MGRSHPWLEELDQPREASRISRTCPRCDGPVSSSSRGEGSSYNPGGGSSTSSCRRRMSKAASTGGTESRRKEEEQPKSKQQEQAQALVALQAITMMFIYYCAQTQRTSPTSVSGFNNSTITGGVHISNTTNSDSDGTKSEPFIISAKLLTQRFSVPRPKTPREKRDVLLHYFTRGSWRTFRSGLGWRSKTVLAALFLIYAASSHVYYQRALLEWCPFN